MTFIVPQVLRFGEILCGFFKRLENIVANFRTLETGSKCYAPGEGSVLQGVTWMNLYGCGRA